MPGHVTDTDPISRALLLSTLSDQIETAELLGAPAMVVKALDGLLKMKPPVPELLAVNAKPKVAPEIAPVKLSPPELPIANTEEPIKVIAPDAVAVLTLVLLRAPPALPPLRIKLLATDLPLRSTELLPITVTEPVPNGPSVTLPVVLAPALRVPALTVVPPLKVLAPDSVQVP